MTELMPAIKQISQVGNDMYIQGAFPVGVATTEVDYLADPADTHLLASRDPVINEVSVGMTGNEIKKEYVTGTPPLTLSDSEGYPLQWWQVNLSPYQEGTGDPAPDNVRPIHGTSKLNLFVEESYDPTATPKAVITMPATGKNLLNIDAGTHNAWAFVNIPNNLQPDTEYTFSLSGNTAYTYTLYLGNSIQSTRPLSQAITGGGSSTFTTPSNMSTEPLLAIAGDVSGAGNEPIANLLPQVELGSTATAYVAYTNSLYGGQVFAGGAVSNLGVIDLGDLIFSASTFTSAYHSFRITNLRVIPPSSDSDPVHAICNCLKSMDYGSNWTPNSIAPNSSGSDLIRIIAPTDVNTVEELKALLAGMQIVYELPAPVSYTFTTSPIPTPTGNATAWATAEDGVVDNMEVTYIKSE